jgi:2-C-methyl-D-erythritol 2,4-cyclodiphosphate synthase
MERLSMRVGFGYDVHRFAEGRPLMIGGVEVPHPMGLAGHSDADVLLHAIVDALIGAAGLGDIGSHFPPTDPAFKDISSIKLLERTTALLREKGYRVINIDSTVVCEAPRLAPHVPAMIESISRVLGCRQGLVNVKGKTEEGLGFTGSGDGIKAYAVALVEESS